MRTRTNPKEILLEEFMKPLGMDYANILSKLPHLYQRHYTYVYLKKTNSKINKEVAESLSFVFGTSKEFWLNLQKNYDESRGE